MAEDYFCLNTVKPLLEQPDHNIDAFHARLLRVFAERSKEMQAQIPGGPDPRQNEARILYQQALNNNTLGVQNSAQPFPIYMDKDALLGALACYDHAPPVSIDAVRGELNCDIRNSTGMLTNVQTNAIGKKTPAPFFQAYGFMLCFFGFILFCIGLVFQGLQRSTRKQMGVF